ncbi:MAG: DUF4331 family protein [Candidatus Eremiobacteraeota bacterium]|nr:DUF4331 family protein [Candidatus Eremiobacteraeota bacterium]
MKFVRYLGGLAAAVALVAIFAVYANHPARSSDHQDSPATIARPGADITDPYIFPSPRDPTKAVIVMNVHPLIPSGQAGSTFFDPGVLYQMKFDNVTPNTGGGAPKEDLVIQFAFGAAGAGQQVFVYGPASPVSTGTQNALLPQLTGSGTINKPFTAGNMQVFAGGREDSFFFDLRQFLKILPDRNAGNTTTPLQPGGLPSCLPKPLGGNNTCPQGFNSVGSDTLKGFNVLTMVVELPRSMLQGTSGSKLAFWTTTSTVGGN